MRCPNCNKFVSYDEPEVEIDEGTISEGEGENKFTATASVRIILKCVEFEHKCEEKDFDVEDLELNEITGEGFSRVETKDQRGKPIKSARYMKTYYGAELTLEASCGLCWESLIGSEKVECQASAFDELV